jgi:hypothetical protein
MISHASDSYPQTHLRYVLSVFTIALYSCIASYYISQVVNSTDGYPQTCLSYYISQVVILETDIPIEVLLALDSDPEDIGENEHLAAISLARVGGHVSLKRWSSSVYWIIPLLGSSSVLAHTFGNLTSGVSGLHASVEIWHSYMSGEWKSTPSWVPTKPVHSNTSPIKYIYQAKNKWNACGTHKHPNIKMGETETNAASGVLVLGDECPVSIVWDDNFWQHPNECEH